MNLKLILALIQFASAVMVWLERERIKAEGKAEAYAESKEAHDQRVAQANAARADADELAGLHDPFDRDNANRR